MDERTKEVKLSRVYKFGPIETDVLLVREPTVKDQLAISKIPDEVQRDLKFLANLCQAGNLPGLNPKDLEPLRLADLGRLNKAVKGFIESDEETSED